MGNQDKTIGLTICLSNRNEIHAFEHTTFFLGFYALLCFVIATLPICFTRVI